MKSKPSGYALGLDTGSASIGWALVDLDDAGYPCGPRALGVRIFDPGVDGLIEKGLEESRNVARRQARLSRRMLRRRAARRRELFRLLQHSGLLPESNGEEKDVSERQHKTLQDLDRTLTERWRGRADLPVIATDHLLPYLLRKSALSERLEPYELGRALFHLAQRRGFKTNRKQARAAEAEKEQGEVNKGINELDAAMSEAGAPTLGAYLAGLDPVTYQSGFPRSRVRRRWTAREMFENEFNSIWNAQRTHHTNLLTDSLRAEVKRILFDQRPILFNEDSVGECELERGEKRAAWTNRAAQRFRLLQGLNNLQVERGPYDKRPLSAEERARVLIALESGDATLALLRRVIGLSQGEHFNFERGSDKKKIPGDRIAGTMRKALGQRWEEISEPDRDRLVKRWSEEESPDVLRAELETEWGVESEAARALASVDPEPGYCSLSLKAIRNLLPLMESGLPFKTAELKAYGERPVGQGCTKLPPVEDVLPAANNPAVKRALTELRKVVNAIVAEHGKPFVIRVELARDLKTPRDVRKRIFKRNEERNAERERAKQFLIENNIRPSARDIEKYLLWDECGRICPYTGRSISMNDLFYTSQFDIEHIVPLGIYPDDSFANKTLCWADENRHVKQSRLPAQAYSTDDLARIVDRVKRWPHPNRAKLERFQLESFEKAEEFTRRQLTDTRYAAKLARRYLNELFSEEELRRSDGTLREVVQATSGSVTATLRRHWGLEKILGQPKASANGQNPGKPRTDHRHHAIDALVIALTSQGVVQGMAVAAAGGYGIGETGTRSMRRIPSPWPNFVDSLRPHVDALIASHRPEHRLNGPLHTETNYGVPRAKGAREVTHVRKSLENIKAGEVEKIIDPAVKKAVIDKIDQAGGLDAFKRSILSDPPVLRSKDGCPIPIFRVRIELVQSLRRIGTGSRERFVIPANNHHMEVFCVRDRRGAERWEGVVVSLLDARNRLRSGKRPKQVVSRHLDGHPDAEFQFSIMNGDTLSLRGEHSGKCRDGIWVVRTIQSNGQILLMRANDARKRTQLSESGDRWAPTIEALRKLSAVKVAVDPLGRVRETHD